MVYILTCIPMLHDHYLPDVFRNEQCCKLGVVVADVHPVQFNFSAVQAVTIHPTAQSCSSIVTSGTRTRMESFTLWIRTGLQAQHLFLACHSQAKCVVNQLLQRISHDAKRTDFSLLQRLQEAWISSMDVVHCHFCSARNIQLFYSSKLDS